MDVVILSRLQFAVATMFHFLFVPVTMGLGVLIAIMETRYVRTGDEDYRRLARFFGKLFLLGFVVGVVTGLTLEFQFGTNWSRYSAFVGDIFGPPLAVEVLTSFFLESTFIALWAFGWERLSPKKHAVCIWLVAGATVMSAFWILVANAWMQSPVGYELRTGRAELVSFWRVIFQPFAILEFIHTVAAAFVVGGFVVMAICAYHILRRHEPSAFVKALRIALVFTFASLVVVLVEGDFHAKSVATDQPVKLAAMEAQWETQRYAPIHVIQWPDAARERNQFEWGRIPSALSVLAYYKASAQVRGLKDWPPQDRPPVALVFVAFRGMVVLGIVMLALLIWGLWRRRALEQSPAYLRVLMLALPLPFLATQLGWIVTEVGRQPWIVYNLLRVDHAASPVSAGQVAVSLAAFVVVYSLTGLIVVTLMVKFIRRGLASQTRRQG